MDKSDECPCCKKIVSNYDLHVVQCSRQQERQQMKRMHPSQMEEEDEHEEEKEEKQFQKQLKYDKLGDNQKKVNNGQPREYPLGFGTQEKRENQEDSQDKDQQGQEGQLKKEEQVQQGSQQKPDSEEQQDEIKTGQESKEMSGQNNTNGSNQKENTSNEQNDEITCPNCNKILTFETIGNHIETCQNREEPCQFCEKSFPAFLLQEHLNVCEKAPHTNSQQSSRRQNSRRRRQPSRDRPEEEEEQGQFESFSERNQAGEHESEEDDEFEFFRILSQLGNRRQNSRQPRVQRDQQNSSQQQAQQSQSSSQQREDRAARRRAQNNNPFRQISRNYRINQDQQLNIFFNGMNFNGLVIEDQGDRRQSRDPLQNLIAGLLQMANNHDPSNNGGLNAHQMKDFPEHKFHKQDGLNPDQSKCTICMSDYEENDKVKVLDCLHSYHSECIDVWLKKNSKCPVCKKDMKEFV